MLESCRNSSPGPLCRIGLAPWFSKTRSVRRGREPPLLPALDNGWRRIKSGMDHGRRLESYLGMVRSCLLHNPACVISSTDQFYFRGSSRRRTRRKPALLQNLGGSALSISPDHGSTTKLVLPSGSNTDPHLLSPVEHALR